MSSGICRKKKRQQQGANVRAVDVGVRHQDDAVVAHVVGLVVLDVVARPHPGARAR